MPINFNIVDNNQLFAVIDKPPNLNFHDDEAGMGFFNQVKQQLAAEHLYPVHRLDKITSGLIIVAKSQVVAQQFQQLFEQRKIEKFYLAISDKKPKKKQGLIRGDMQKARRGSWKLLKTTLNPAITQFFSYAPITHCRLFLLKPHTGKTHQLRVALNSLGSAILGDPTYNQNSSSDRGYLHAYSLRFTLDDTDYSYQSMPCVGKLFLEDDIQHFIANKLAQPWQLTWPNIKNTKKSA